MWGKHLRHLFYLLVESAAYSSPTILFFTWKILYRSFVLEAIFGGEFALFSFFTLERCLVSHLYLVVRFVERIFDLNLDLHSHVNLNSLASSDTCLFLLVCVNFTWIWICICTTLPFETKIWTCFCKLLWNFWTLKTIAIISYLMVE